MIEDAKDNGEIRDRKSTRLNSSHDQISYAVFCLKKKKPAPPAAPPPAKRAAQENQCRRRLRRPSEQCVPKSRRRPTGACIRPAPQHRATMRPCAALLRASNESQCPCRSPRVRYSDRAPCLTPWPPPPSQ